MLVTIIRQIISYVKECEYTIVDENTQNIKLIWSQLFL